MKHIKFLLFALAFFIGINAWADDLTLSISSSGTNLKTTSAGTWNNALAGGTNNVQGLPTQASVEQNLGNNTNASATGFYYGMCNGGALCASDDVTNISTTGFAIRGRQAYTGTYAAQVYTIDDAYSEITVSFSATGSFTNTTFSIWKYSGTTATLLAGEKANFTASNSYNVKNIGLVSGDKLILIWNANSGAKVATISDFTGTLKEASYVNLLTWSDINSMQTGDSKNIVLANPHKTAGYFLGYSGSACVGSTYGGDVATGLTNAKSLVDQDNYKLILTKNESGYVIESADHAGYYLTNSSTGGGVWSTTPYTWTFSNGNVIDTDNLVTGLYSGSASDYLFRIVSESNYLNSEGSATSVHIATNSRAGAYTQWCVYEDTRHTVTYRYLYQGEQYGDLEVHEGIEDGSTYPSPTLVLPYKVSLTGLPESTATVTADQTIELTIDISEFPFTFSTDFNDATWYTWKMRSGYAKFNGTNFPEQSSSSQPTDTEYLFAVTGDPFAFQFFIPNGQYVNQTATNNAKATASTTATTFHIVETGNSTRTYGNYTFYLDGTTASNGTVNDVNNSIGYWGNTAALSDVGSQITLDATARKLYSIEFAGEVPSGASVTYTAGSVTVNYTDDSHIINTDAAELGADDFEVSVPEGYELTSKVMTGGRTLTVTFEATDPQIVKNEELKPLIDTAKAKLDANKGYPGQRSEEIKTAFKTIYDAAVTIYDMEEATISQVEGAISSLQTALEAYNNNTSMINPSEGKVYFLNLRDGSDTASDRTEYYLYDNDDDTPLKANTTANGDTPSYPESAAMVVSDLGEGIYVMKSALGRYVKFLDANTGNTLIAMSSTYDNSAKFKIYNLRTETSNSNVSKANTEDLTYLHNVGTNDRVVVFKQSGKTADGASAPYFNGSFTSGIAWVEAEGYIAYKVVFETTGGTAAPTGAAATWTTKSQTITDGDAAPYFVSTTAIETSAINPADVSGYNSAVTYDDDTKTFTVTYSEIPREYTVEVTGLPTPADGGVTYNEEEVKHGATLEKTGTLTTDEVPAIAVTNYKANVSIDVTNLTVNVNYILNNTDGLNNQSYYILQTEGRGHWKYDTEKGYIIGTTEEYSDTDDYSKFAWIKSEKGNFYLYNIGLAQFVTANDGAEGYTMTDEPDEPVTINTSNLADDPFYLSVGNYWFNTNGVYVTELNTWNIQDYGNRMQFIYGGAYDLQDAIDKVESFENPPQLTFVIDGVDTPVTYNGQSYTNNQTVNASGFDITKLEAPIFLNYCATTTLHSSEVRVHYEQLPFVASDNSNTNVYGMKTASATDSYRWYKYITDGDDAGKAWRAKRDWMDLTDKTEQWIFRIVSKGSGNHAIQIVPYADTDKCLSYETITNGNGIVAKAPNTDGWYGDWVIATNGSGIGFKPFGDTENYFLNCYTGKAAKAGFWNSNDDAGSQLTFTLANEAEGRYDITITSATRGTFACEYPLDFSKVYQEDGETLAEGFVAYYCSGANETNSTVVMHPVTGTIIPEVGLYVGGAKGTYKVRVATEGDTPDGDYSGLVPVLPTTEGVSNGLLHITQSDGTYTNFILQKNSAGLKFYKVNNTTGNNVGVHRAYLRLQLTNPEAKEYFDIDGDATGIEFVDQDGHSIDALNGVMYDLNGRRVNEDYKGVVIVNGKKILNK